VRAPAARASLFSTQLCVELERYPPPGAGAGAARYPALLLVLLLALAPTQVCTWAALPQHAVRVAAPLRAAAARPAQKWRSATGCRSS
jgi:hypothetical protein